MLCEKDGKWVEEDTFDFILNSNTEFPFKLIAETEVKNIEIKIDSEIPKDLAILNNLDTIHIFTKEDVYYIPSLNKSEEKYLVLRVQPESTGDYKVSFNFDYLVR